MDITQLARIISEDPDVLHNFDGYHCTTVEAARLIDKQGFKVIPDDLRDYFYNIDSADIMPIFARMLLARGVDEAGPLLDTLDSEGYLESYDLLSALWKAEFGDGTLIWLSQEPDTSHGEVCYGVRLPGAAISLFELYEYVLYYVPASIPPENLSKQIHQK